MKGFQKRVIIKIELEHSYNTTDKTIYCIFYIMILAYETYGCYIAAYKNAFEQRFHGIFIYPFGGEALRN